MRSLWSVLYTLHCERMGFVSSETEHCLSNSMYIIAATPRTGGHLLCELLASTEICGRPHEYVLLKNEHIWRNSYGCRTRQEYRAYYLQRGWSANGVFGAKLTWWQFCELTAELGGEPLLNSPNRASVIERTFGCCRYIFLRRRDRVRQAISYFRARQTQRWSSKTASKKSPAAEVFDVDALDELMRAISLGESCWLAYLSELGVNYLSLFYEDLVHAPRMWVAQILGFVGVHHQWAGICRSELQRQSDEVTEEWVRRYKALRNPSRPSSSLSARR
jgi:trehalose 2-sulfotransferase